MDYLEEALTAFNRWNDESPPFIAIDTETKGVDFYAEPFCVTVAWGNKGHYFELGHDKEIESCLEKMLNVSNLVFHNAKFDMQKLQMVGLIEDVNPDRIEDTEALAHLIDEHQEKKLKVLARNILGEETDEEERVKETKKELQKQHKKDTGKTLYVREIHYGMLPREVIIPYAIKDAEFTIRLFEILYPQVKKHADLFKLYRREMELTRTLLRIETAGLKVDIPYLQDKVKEYNTLSLQKELEIRSLTGKEDFNPNSPKQVIETFADIGITLEKTDKYALAEVDHPLADAIVELRNTRKLCSTYFEGLLAEERDGIVHPNYRQHKPVTGRLASGGREGDSCSFSITSVIEENGLPKQTELGRLYVHAGKFCAMCPAI
jgi:DNA polymerase-1